MVQQPMWDPVPQPSWNPVGTLTVQKVFWDCHFTINICIFYFIHNFHNLPVGNFILHGTTTHVGTYTATHLEPSPPGLVGLIQLQKSFWTEILR